jgi:hypothetical protein
MTFTLSGWTVSTTTLLLRQLPLQTYDAATALVESYLSAAGGWTPTSVGDPTGLGAPVDGSTPETASAAISSGQFARMNHVSATVNVVMTMDILANLISGQTNAAVLTQINSIVEDTITNQLIGTSMSLSSVSSVTGTVTADGISTTAQRVAIEALISTSTYNGDPRAIGVVEARRIYALDSTWSFHSFYTENGTEIAVIIRKYTSSTFATLDTTNTGQYIISIQPNGFTVIGGTVV